VPLPPSFPAFLNFGVSHVLFLLQVKKLVVYPEGFPASCVR
jgi:hypothetical protein